MRFKFSSGKMKVTHIVVCLIAEKCLYIGLFGFLFVCLFVPENMACLFVHKQVFPRKHTSGPDLDKWHAGLVEYQKATPKELISHLLLAYGSRERYSQILTLK